MTAAKLATVPGPSIAWEMPTAVVAVERAWLKSAGRSLLKIWLIGMTLFGAITLALIHHLAPELTRRSAVGLGVMTVALPILVLFSLVIDLRTRPRYTIDATGLQRRTSSRTYIHRWKYLLGYRIVPHDEAAGMKCLEFRGRFTARPIAWPFDPSTVSEHAILDAIRHHRPDLDPAVGF